MPLQQLEPPPVVSKRWAACMKKVFEIDPLGCPNCGGQMKIKSFITDSNEVERLAKNLGIVTWRAPPKLNASLPHAA